MTADKLFKKASDKISILTGIVRTGDENSAKHCKEVAIIVSKCIEIGQKLNFIDWDDNKCVDIVVGALLIDSGMAFLPFNLYYADRPLTTAERHVIETHPWLGLVLSEHINLSEVSKNIILMHHANADGTGYPFIDKKPLVSDDMTGNYNEVVVVPDYVWLVIYADRFSALTEDKIYRPGLSYAEAWRHIHKMIKEKKISYKYRRVFENFVERNGFNCKNISKKTA